MRKHKLLKISLLVFTLILVAATTYAVIFDKRSTNELNKVIAIANKFQLPADWKLEKESLHKDTVTGCIDTECPSVYRRYTFETIPVTDINKFKNYFASSGLLNITDFNCNLEDSGNSNYGVCSAQNKYNNMTIYVNAISENGQGVDSVVFMVF